MTMDPGVGPNGTAPPGYLGAQARITSGPAPELVAAGYQLETDDAPLLHRGLSLADLAHQVVLAEAGAVPAGAATPLIRALLDLVDSDPADFPYDAVYGDAYNSRERQFERTLGPTAGWLHLGRTRREAGRIAFRMALRERLLELYSDVCDLAVALAAAESAYATTWWADSTYLQPAQPSTLGHYFGQFGEQCVRHLDRIEAAYRTADSCPGGAGGSGGTRIPIDRGRIAELLGFAEVGAHTRDSMWSVDMLSDAVNAAAAAVLTVDELAEDLEIFASPAFDFVELDASLCRASVLMPQKRNPYALAVIRGGAGTVIGRATGLLATAKSPSARTDNWLYAYGEVTGAVELSSRLIRLGAAVVRGVRPRTAVLARAAAANFIGAADLAEDLSLQHGLDYRTSYKIVGHAVAAAVRDGASELTVAAVALAAREITGMQLVPDPALLRRTTRPEELIAARSSVGCAAPDRVFEHAQRVRARVGAAAGWRLERRATIDEAERQLLADARRLAGRG
jgi:argininosuccinate lyase